VSIFESTVADLVSCDVPATEDFGDGFWSTETLFVQPVEGVGAGGRFYICDFFDPEVFGGAFQFHPGVRYCVWSGGIGIDLVRNIVHGARIARLCVGLFLRSRA